MKIIDFVTGIPYRIVGFIGTLFTLIAIFVTVLLPSFIHMLIYGNNTWMAQYFFDNIVGEDATVKEVMDIIKNMGLLGSLCSFWTLKFLKYTSFLFAGVYCDDMYNKIMNMKFNQEK